jgi:SAM-dependent methyltransferase
MPRFVVEFGDDGRSADGRLDAPAFHRNHAPIWSVIAPFVQECPGDVLEVGSGTGQHIVEFARKAPDIIWWPSDTNAKHLASIAAWRAHAGLPNLRAPLPIDLGEPGWDANAAGIETVVGRGLLAMVCINVLHIAPWRVTENLLAGAGRRLRPDGRLFVYGPFRRDGAHTAPSNAAFDASLRAQNTEWGVRDMGDIAAAAAGCGLRVAEIVPMPANNFVLVMEIAAQPG